MSATPLNLVFIMSDEQSSRFIGIDGRERVRTPNLDRLAARGRYFRNAYTPSPICVPTRAAIATGQYVHRIGYWDNALAYDGRVPSWGHALQAAGIRVESIGKLHYRNAELPTGFDRQHLPMHLAAGHGMIWGSIRDPLPVLPYRERPRMIGPTVGPGESSYTRFDRAVAESAVEWLADAAKQPSGRPWALFVGFVAPHFPLIAPPEFAALYPTEQMRHPKLRPETGYRRHPWLQAMHDYWPHDDGFVDDDERMRAIAMYHALCSAMDANVGRVLDAVQNGPLAANTRVIYTSDHGDNLGARGMWGKSTLYEESVAVPLIVAGPDVTPARSEAPVSLLDLYPTVLDAVGVPGDKRADRPGRSLLSGEADSERVIFSEYHAVGSPSAGFMIRRGRWKYNHYVGYPPELFDLAADPEELTDLAAEPRCAGVVRDLEAELRRVCDPQSVDRAAKAAQAALVAQFGGREAAQGIGNIGATPPPAA